MTQQEQCPACGADKDPQGGEWFSCSSLYSYMATERDFLQSDFCRIRQLGQQVERLRAERDHYRAACEHTENEIQQILGKALGFPRYCDDPTNFPTATEADGVCVGEHTAATLASELVADRDQLAAVCNRLPNDADGNPLVPGDRVTGPFDGEGTVLTIHANGLILVLQPQGTLIRMGSELRQVEQAAREEAARSAK